MHTAEKKIKITDVNPVELFGPQETHLLFVETRSSYEVSRQRSSRSKASSVS